jgi:outer membrane protein TolC
VQLAGPQPADINKWVELAETSGSATVQIYQALSEIAQREVEKQRAGHYPTLDLVATRGRSSAGSSGFSCPLPAVGTDSNRFDHHRRATERFPICSRAAPPSPRIARPSP